MSAPDPLPRLALVALLMTGPALRADHGPGTSGGGLSVPSGETLKAGRFSLEWRTDVTTFRRPSEADLRAKAGDGEIDLLDRSLLHSLTLAYGFGDACQVSATLGTYTPSGGATASLDPETGELVRTANRPQGLTDLWLQGKWAFHRGPVGRIAAFAGLKLPTGRTDARDEAGEPVDLASTPGSGAVDTLLGLGYSTFLTARWTLDAGLTHTWRGTHRDTRLGDRLDAGVGVAYRFTRDLRSFPQASAFLELNHRRLGRLRIDGEAEANSGGRALFASPGLRVGFTPRMALTVAAQLPLSQSLHGAQIETRLKAVAALSVAF